VKNIFGLLILLVSCISFASTLEVVKKRGKLRCGVSTGLAGFSTPDSKGEWRGMDVDICKAIASAIFNDPGKVDYVFKCSTAIHGTSIGGN
jgi:general L-amino acid transport system substrate-binding protein